MDKAQKDPGPAAPGFEERLARVIGKTVLEEWINAHSAPTRLGRECCCSKTEPAPEQREKADTNGLRANIRGLCGNVADLSIKLGKEKAESDRLSRKVRELESANTEMANSEAAVWRREESTRLANVQFQADIKTLRQQLDIKIRMEQQHLAEMNKLRGERDSWIKAAGEEAHISRKLREALQLLYSETCDYIRVNNLGDVHHNRSMQLARDALNPPMPGLFGPNYTGPVSDYEAHCQQPVKENRPPRPEPTTCGGDPIGHHGNPAPHPLTALRWGGVPPF